MGEKPDEVNAPHAQGRTPRLNSAHGRVSPLPPPAGMVQAWTPNMRKASHPPTPEILPGPAARPGLWRWLPVLLLVAVAGLGYGLGLQRQISLAALVEHRDALAGWVEQNQALALAAYGLIYVAVAAFSIPVAAALSIAGGLLFGWVAGAAVSTVAATIGAAIVFEIVKTSFGAALAARSGPFLERLQQGFAENAVSLMLFLRLTPVFPFWVVNAVAGLSRVPLRTFVLTTFAGIIPGAIAFALIGSGLGTLIDDQALAFRVCAQENGAENCSLSLSPADFVSPELLWGLTGLGLVALLPLVLRLWKERRR